MLAAGVVAAGAPLWGGLVVVAAVTAAVGTIGHALATTRRHGRIDPFAVREPWRQHLRGVLAARRRFAEARRRAGTGPRATRLAEIALRVEQAVDTAWVVAREGQSLTDARRAIDVERARRLLDADDTDPDRRASARAQLEAHERLTRRERRTSERLSRLEERLREAAARATELAVADPGGDAGGLLELVDDVDGIVGELEALRRAVAELDRPDDLPGP